MINRKGLIDRARLWADDYDLDVHFAPTVPGNDRITLNLSHPASEPRRDLRGEATVGFEPRELNSPDFPAIFAPADGRAQDRRTCRGVI